MKHLSPLPKQCHVRPPDRSRIAGRSLAVLFLVGMLVVCIPFGCSSSSPRFKGSSKTTTSTTKTTQEQRFATKIRREEMAEDDKKVNIEEVKERFSTGTVTRSNRTSAIDRRKVMTEILGLIGTPYALGNSDSDGMDCSAFTTHIYEKAIGQSLPRSTADQHKIGQSVGSGRLRFGDLLFFNTTGESPSHVGIFIGDDLFAHASVSYGVTISSLQSSYYKKRYIGAKRVVD